MTNGNASAEQRKLAAIMFTDMMGYSAPSQRDDKLALELLEEHRQLPRDIFPRFNGTEIKTIGDAFLIEFNSALEVSIVP
jgi:adenylate cyclase